MSVIMSEVLHEVAVKLNPLSVMNIRATAVQPHRGGRSTHLHTRFRVHLLGFGETIHGLDHTRALNTLMAYTNT